MSTPTRTYTHQDVDNTRIYYQEFHHTLIGWFLTVSGLFFAGLLALDPATVMNGRLILWVVGLMLVLTAVAFLYVIARFAARINNLHVFANEQTVRSDWMQKHKDGFYDAAGGFKKHKYSVAGVGCRFFIALMLILGLQKYDDSCQGTPFRNEAMEGLKNDFFKHFKGKIQAGEIDQVIKDMKVADDFFNGVD